VSNNSANGSTARWRRLRAQHLKAYPLCAWCHRAPATEVDHILPLARYPELRYDPGNIRGLCQLCHDQRHGSKKVRIDAATGLPLQGQGHHWWSA
jgi:5-methylcytosine-specific restriction endonuclease McrA